jgi:hypothetical protein
MSSVVLETQSFAMSGPVISVSCSSGGVTSEMPASRAGPEIWPPWPALVAE